MLTEDNYQEEVYVFGDRQAGISCIYNPEGDQFSYNAYCLEKKLLKELFSSEHEFLSEAIELINSEFGTWQIHKLDGSTSCGSCAAK